MAKNVKSKPEGTHTITPYLIVRDANKAIDLYAKAFGAQKVLALPTPDGKTMHAQIKIGDSKIMLGEECEQMGALSPESRGFATSSLLIYIDDVDAAFDKAIKAGCTVKMPVMDMFWGDRYGAVVDPFGHSWSLATHVEDVSEEEMIKRGAEHHKKMTAQLSGAGAQK